MIRSLRGRVERKPVYSRRSSASMDGGQAAVGLDRRRREAAALRAAGLQRDQAIRRGARRSTRRRPRAPAAARAGSAPGPASGAPASTITSAPSSATQRSASATSRSPWSPCTLPISASGSVEAADARQAACRGHRLCTVSRYQARMRCEMATIEKRWPSRQRAGQRRFGQAGDRDRAAPRAAPRGRGRRRRRRPRASKRA